MQNFKKFAVYQRYNMSFIITTPLFYVNDKPHLGSTYTTLACDTLARFRRLEGEEVVFAGSDLVQVFS